MTRKEEIEALQVKLDAELERLIATAHPMASTPRKEILELMLSAIEAKYPEEKNGQTLPFQGQSPVELERELIRRFIAEGKVVAAPVTAVASREKSETAQAIRAVPNRS